MYFYHVFPLHLNTFNRLFSDVINPKLLELTKSVGEFIRLNSDVDSFIDSLKDIFKYLSYFNPAQELLELIQKFSGDSYAEEVKSHLEQLIDNLIGLDVNNKYEQIIENFHSLARQYNHLLSVHYQNFKTKIGEHKTSLEESIKQYVFYIRYDLSYDILPLISNLISIIGDNIENLKTNNGKLDEFTKYPKKEQLMKKSQQTSRNGSGTELSEQDMNKLDKIVNTHGKYKQCLQKCSEITNKLNLFKLQLKYYKKCVMYARNSLYKYNDSVINSTNIDELVNYLNSLNSRYVKIDEYIKCVQDLEEIGEHIKTMKSELTGIESKVDEGAVKYIQGLKEITIKKDEVQKDIKNIQNVNESIIARLNIGKHTIQFYNSLHSEISKLNKPDVKFETYDIPEFLKNSQQIQEKLRSFGSQIKEAINKIKGDIDKIKKNIFPDSYKTEVEQDYTSDIQKINNIINIISQILNLECAIEGVARNFIQCSLQSLSNNTTVTVMNDNRYKNLLDKRVADMYSLIKVIDYNVVVNRLYDSAKKIHNIFEFIYSSYDCGCIDDYENKNNGISNNYLGIDKYVFREETNDQIYKIKTVDQIKRLYGLNLDGNHLCLCMVIKYVMYPSVINIIQILGTELDTLSTISRKYEKYTHTTSVGSSVIFLLIVLIGILESITNWIRINYPYGTILYEGGVKIKCFCYYQDKYYHMNLNIILFVSSLMENMWTMDTETIRMSIERLSTLIRDFDMIDSQNKSICNNNIYWLLVDKECQPQTTEKCCCCWCVAFYNLGIIVIYLCLQFKLYKAIPGKKVCDDWKKWFELEDCECNCQTPVNGVCCVLQSALSELTCGYEELKKKLEDCSTACTGECCCKKLKEKVKTGLCKVLLLGCECSCTDGADSEVKANCVFFNDLNKRTRVAVVVFCKCKDHTKECCLNQLIKNLEGKVKKICDQDCCCKEVQKVCEEICGKDCTECVCKTLQEQWKKICKGNGNCGDNSKCLCQEFKDAITNLCTKGTCPCRKPGNICCRCPCCKIVAHSIKILARACRANVLEPYKRITLDLIGSSKDKTQLVRNIVNRINNGTINRISSLKISCSSYPNLNTKNSIQSRNWGYDTQHEHEPTSNTSSDGYPNLQSTNRTGGSGNKMFKLVLSRLLICAFIVLMFVYLRISYQQFLLFNSSDVSDVDNIDPNNNLDNSSITTDIDITKNIGSGSSYLVDMFLNTPTYRENYPSTEIDTDVGNGTESDVSAINRIKLIIQRIIRNRKVYCLILLYVLICAMYLNVVVRDLRMLRLESEMWSYLMALGVTLALLTSLVCKYWVHLYDFMRVLESYGRKLSKVHCVIDHEEIRAIFESISEHVDPKYDMVYKSKFVMVYSLLATLGKDLLGIFTLNINRRDSSTYNEMKKELYPYKDMSEPIVRLTKSVQKHGEDLAKIRDGVVEALGIPGETVDVYNVLDFVSYILMSKGFGYLDEYQAYFYGNERYVSWRLGKALNHNFFLVTYYRYQAIFAIDKQVQNIKLGKKHVAKRNCMLLWQVFGQMEIQLITLKSMAEDSITVPMTDIQKDVLKSRFNDEYLNEFLRFQLYIMNKLFRVREQMAMRTKEIESSFPFADLFEEKSLDRETVQDLSSKYFEQNYRKILGSMAMPTRTCLVTGHPVEVKRRVKALSISNYSVNNRHGINNNYPIYNYIIVSNNDCINIYNVILELIIIHYLIFGK